MNHADKQSKHQMRQWLADHSHRFTHALTLTLTNEYATADGAATVARRFHHKLNKAVWGGRKCDTHRIAWAAVVQGGELERFHIHAAVGNFPKHLAAHIDAASGVKYSETPELLRRVKQTIKHTEGVWTRNDFAALDLNEQAWTDYISRRLRDGNDVTLLVDDMEFGSK